MAGKATIRKQGFDLDIKINLVRPSDVNMHKQAQRN
jgi:hypothetical protein